VVEEEKRKRRGRVSEIRGETNALYIEIEMVP